MTAKQHSIPPFYCCYLLRSISKPNSFYIGSSPDPVRRLRQHNGAVKRGGAYRTKRNNTRPWKMVCFVYGFTSKIAALQFEHAWQHSYKTRFIGSDERLVSKKNTRTGMATKLGNLRLLMKHPYFDKMSLHIRFFDRLAWETWEFNKFKIDFQASHCEIDEASMTDDTELDDVETAHLERIRCFYQEYLLHDKDMFNRYQERLIYGEHHCMICDATIDYIEETGTQLTAFCTHEKCTFISCLKCLYRNFTIESGEIVPKTGCCPSCNKQLEWASIVKYSTTIREKLLGD